MNILTKILKNVAVFIVTFVIIIMIVFNCIIAPYEGVTENQYKEAMQKDKEITQEYNEKVNGQKGEVEKLTEKKNQLSDENKELKKELDNLKSN